MEDFELNERENDLLAIEDYYGNQAFVWNGATYVCTPSPSSDIATLGVGGFGGDATADILVRTSQLTGGYPAKGDLLTLNGQDYEVEKVTPDTAGKFLVLHLVYPSP